MSDDTVEVVDASDVEVINQNKFGSTEQLKQVKEKSTLVKDIILTVLPLVLIVLVLIIILVRFLF